VSGPALRRLAGVREEEEEDGGDSFSDRKWFSTRPIRRKHDAHVWAAVRFGKYVYVSELKGEKWISA